MMASHNWVIWPVRAIMNPEFLSKNTSNYGDLPKEWTNSGCHRQHLLVWFNLWPHNCLCNNEDDTKCNQLVSVTRKMEWIPNLLVEIHWTKLSFQTNELTETAVGNFFLCDSICNPVSVRTIIKAPKVTSLASITREDPISSITDLLVEIH